MPDGFERTFDLEAVLIRLLDHLDPVEPALAAVRTQYGFDAHVTVNIQLDEEVTPNGTLRATTLARLDIDLDLDLYTTQGV